MVHDVHLIGLIKGTGNLIEEKDPGVLEESSELGIQPGNLQSLAFTAGKFDAALAQNGFVAVRHGLNRVVDVHAD